MTQVVAGSESKDQSCPVVANRLLGRLTQQIVNSRFSFLHSTQKGILLVVL